MALVILRGHAAAYDGHVAELVAESRTERPGELIVVRILSTGATTTIRSEHATLLPARTPPGESVMLHCCVPERFLRRMLLPLLKHDEIFELVLGFLQIKQVVVEGVRAVGASSSAEYQACAPQYTLTPDDRSWWISRPSSCPNGVGFEWVLYELCSAEQGRARVSYIQLKIPPLPNGPLSVRRFYLEAADEPQGPFVRASPNLTTFDTDRMQEWALAPPIEARYVRVVCTMNAAADESASHTASGIFGLLFPLPVVHLELASADSIGFFRIGFS